MSIEIKTPKQKRNLLMALSALALTSSVLQLIGVFGVGSLSPYVGLVGALLVGMAAIKMHRQIPVPDRDGRKRPLWLKILLGPVVLIVSLILAIITAGLYVSYQNEQAFKTSDQLAAELFADLIPNWSSLSYDALAPHLSPIYFDEDDRAEVAFLLEGSRKLMRYKTQKSPERYQCKVMSYDDSIACTYYVSADYTTGEARFEFNTRVVESKLLITSFSISSRVFK